eukprot:7926558-Pyramimonas_sp.AAC.1
MKGNVPPVFPGYPLWGLFPRAVSLGVFRGTRNQEMTRRRPQRVCPDLSGFRPVRSNPRDLTQ